MVGIYFMKPLNNVVENDDSQDNEDKETQKHNNEERQPPSTEGIE